MLFNAVNAFTKKNICQICGKRKKIITRALYQITHTLTAKIATLLVWTNKPALIVPQKKTPESLCPLLKMCLNSVFQLMQQ